MLYEGGGGLVLVTHGGVPHFDDFTSLALLIRFGPERIVRVGNDQDVLGIVNDPGKRFVVLDIGINALDKLKDLVAVLDHHVQSRNFDVGALPSTLGLVTRFVDVSSAWEPVIRYMDERDRWGPKRTTASVLGLPLGVSPLWAALAEHLINVREIRPGDRIWHMLEEYGEALTSYRRLDPFPMLERFVEVAKQELAGLNLAILPSKLEALKRFIEAIESGASFEEAFRWAREADDDFGIDFTLLVRWSPETWSKLVEVFRQWVRNLANLVTSVARGEVLRRGGIAVLVLERPVPPTEAYRLALRMGKISEAEPTIVVAPSPRGGIQLWRDDKWRDVIDFRKMPDELRRLFKFVHGGGFIAVTETDDLGEATRIALELACAFGKCEKAEEVEKTESKVVA